MPFSVAVMICSVLVIGGRPEEMPEIALDFVSVLNGYYDNQEQINIRHIDYDFLQTWLIPVHVPVFGSKPVFLAMEAKEGTVVRIELFVLSSGEKDVIKATPYNFTDPSLYKPGEFPLKELVNLTLDQLHTNPDCLTTFERIGPDSFTGEYPECEFTVNGKHPPSIVTFNCDEIFGEIPNGSLERHGFGMYDVRRKGDRYKLPFAPDNYVGPCDKQPSEKLER